MSLSLLLFSCNETAASKIKADSKSNSDLKPSYAEITFDKISHDFGNVNEGEIAKTIFTFTNTGENDLYIVDAVGSCGCTVPKYPKNIPIKPGENGEIEVNFDTNGRPNLQQKMIKVSANTPEGGQLLRIQAFVESKNK
ncbi:DUF1573 domain-containing protein [Flavobacteriaceae bacterium]|nr:DUF1573 domain-containing protein [Flavobacteriaceae bacterium]MDC0879061.1 DUF1573 domain-containing protein [Flavobacteriaceae bacterium]|tara:strand:+ start:82 stop:498 length:417 start_codon:yes stop_codon:yes gene_type:complete